MRDPLQDVQTFKHVPDIWVHCRTPRTFFQEGFEPPDPTSGPTCGLECIMNIYQLCADSQCYRHF